MSLINIAIALVIAGAALWAVNRYIPMASSVKLILNIFVVTVLCVWLLQIFGLLDGIRNIRIR